MKVSSNKLNTFITIVVMGHHCHRYPCHHLPLSNIFDSNDDKKSPSSSPCIMHESLSILSKYNNYNNNNYNYNYYYTYYHTYQGMMLWLLLLVQSFTHLWCHWFTFKYHSLAFISSLEFCLFCRTYATLIKLCITIVYHLNYYSCCPGQQAPAPDCQKDRGQLRILGQGTGSARGRGGRN